MDNINKEPTRFAFPAHVPKKDIFRTLYLEWLGENDMQDGPLYNRYLVVYSDWSPVDPRERFFVLSMDTDPYARWALIEYIKACRDEYQNYANSLNSEHLLQLTMPHHPDKVDGPPLPQYRVTHKDGHPVDPKLRYFVLAVDTDPYAREALCRYANDCRATHPQLSEDIIREYGLELNS